MHSAYKQTGARDVPSRRGARRLLRAGTPRAPAQVEHRAYIGPVKICNCFEPFGVHFLFWRTELAVLLGQKWEVKPMSQILNK
jgi:hypothetical protein